MVAPRLYVEDPKLGREIRTSQFGSIHSMSNFSANEKEIPADQALIYVIKKARFTLKWLKQLEIRWQLATEADKDVSQIREQQSVLQDIFTVYISSLFDKRRDVHSLVRSYNKNDFVEQFEKNPFVKMCIKQRHNRAGHQSKKYGSIARLAVLLASDLDKWLDDAFYLVGTGKMPKK